MIHRLTPGRVTLGDLFAGWRAALSSPVTGALLSAVATEGGDGAFPRLEDPR